MGSSACSSVCTAITAREAADLSIPSKKGRASSRPVSASSSAKADSATEPERQTSPAAPAADGAKPAGGRLVAFRAAMKNSFDNPRDAFDVLDKDGDHVVTKDEWMICLGRLGEQAGWDMETLKLCVKFGDAFFDQMDLDGNGKLVFEEFKESLTKKIEGPKNNEALAKFRAAMKKSFKNPKDAFDRLDKDGNQIVTRDEWIATLCEVGAEAKWDDKTMEMCKKFGNDFFSEMDANGNGELVFQEFKDSLASKLTVNINDSSLATFKSCMRKSFKNPKDAFDMLDKDGDRYVSREEWLDTLEEVGLNCKWDAKTMDLCYKFGEAFFDQMDTNGDGNLEFHEFKENLTKKLK